MMAKEHGREAARPADNREEKKVKQELVDDVNLGGPGETSGLTEGPKAEVVVQ